MQFPRDARPLVDACFQTRVESLLELMKPELIQRPKQRQESSRTEPAEPVRLVVRRGYGNIQERSGLVPYTAVIASHNAEAVVARREIRIESLTAIAGILPIAVPAFQLVTKAHLLPRPQAERRIS